ncbi:MAG: hypothetical protein HY097_07005 [Nitrospinae bacterium]|nr:hypothetical protein [Nitrospinota bacterium]
MAASSNVILPKKLHKELINITKKEDTVDAIKELVNREINRKKNKYVFMVKNFEKKYNMEFEEFEKAYKNKKMDYERERDYFEWDMAVTVLEDIDEELKAIE